MTLVGFETEIPSSERPQTHALDGAVTGIGSLKFCTKNVLPELIFRPPNSGTHTDTNLPIFVKKKELLVQKATQLENYLILCLQI